MRGARWVAVAGAAVAFVALGAAEQTGALWRGETRIDGGTIRSGTLALRVGGAAPQTQVQNYQFTGFGGADLAPGSVVQRALTVRNAGDVDMRYRLQSARQSSAALPLTLGVWTVATEGGCPTSSPPAGAALYDGPLPAAQAPTAPQWAPVLHPQETMVWCFRATVGADASPNTTTAVTLDFAASSV
ncbi:hypothetical protein [Rhodococcus sp. SGAir0479]|uniref:hypothetical protein n=1 Tax=Rhodococcus sp. SGAir0479 TaxID=2567884 RepID=UPI0010CD5BE5|nr:hypothetical protein [Rhodococcus sp. SGAir0479]QCQ90551.1 hypothetical protein E7742_04440 [Rhodococcus sp. SGAir0479]